MAKQTFRFFFSFYNILQLLSVLTETSGNNDLLDALGIQPGVSQSDTSSNIINIVDHASSNNKPSSTNSDSLFEWLIGTFGILSGFLIYVILHFVWHFRSIVFRFLFDFINSRLHHEEHAQYTLIYVQTTSRGRTEVWYPAKLEGIEVVDCQVAVSGNIELDELSIRSEGSFYSINME